MQNGDLAEADQSQIDIQEDEGAVGGVLNLAVEPISNNTDLVSILGYSNCKFCFSAVAQIVFFYFELLKNYHMLIYCA